MQRERKRERASRSGGIAVLLIFSGFLAAGAPATASDPVELAEATVQTVMDNVEAYKQAAEDALVTPTGPACDIKPSIGRAWVWDLTLNQAVDWGIASAQCVAPTDLLTGNIVLTVPFQKYSAGTFVDISGTDRTCRATDPGGLGANAGKTGFVVCGHSRSGDFFGEIHRAKFRLSQPIVQVAYSQPWIT